jgi:hypothetical protein
MKKQPEKVTGEQCTICGNREEDYIWHMNFFKMVYGIACHCCTIMLDPDGKRPNLTGVSQRCKHCGYHYNTDVCMRCAEGDF